MKVEDLRINNYVLHYGKVHTFKKKDFDDHVVFEDEFEPIPLTEKWLLDFGFKRKENFVYSDKSVSDVDVFLMDKWKVSKIHDSKRWWAFTKMRDNNIKAVLTVDLIFVHQLQNLYFALTGKELEIKNQV